MPRGSRTVARLFGGVVVRTVLKRRKLRGALLFKRNKSMSAKAIRSYIWDPVECLARPELEKLQVKRLRAGVERVANKVPFYQKKLSEAGVTAASIRSRHDLARLPFTTKADLRDHYPFGLAAVPMKEVVRVHASSGTTGKPTVSAYSRNDFKLWTDLIVRACASAGVTEEDVVHNAYGYGLFTGGLGFHYGAEKLGATVVPASGGNTKRQVTIMRDFGSTVLC